MSGGGATPTPDLGVSLVCEQLLQPVPGGIGTYVRALLSSLPAQGVAVRPVVAWHKGNVVAGMGLEAAAKLPLPRQALYRAWAAGLGPRIPRGSRLVHAPSMAF